METELVVSYALAAIGFALIGWAVMKASRVHVDPNIGNRVMKKLFEANNHTRARKFARISPETYFAAIALAIDAAVASGSKDPVVLTSVATPAFDAKATAIVAAWRKITELGLAGVIVVFGAAALAYTAGQIQVAHLVTSGVALLAGGWFVLRRGTALVAIDAARRELLPALVASVAGGEPAVEQPVDDTGPFRTIGIPKRTRKDAIPSLRDQECPMCGPTATRSIERDGGAFTVLVCTGCGYTQEFADLAKLTP